MKEDGTVDTYETRLTRERDLCLDTKTQKKHFTSLEKFFNVTYFGEVRGKLYVESLRRACDAVDWNFHKIFAQKSAHFYRLLKDKGI